MWIWNKHIYKLKNGCGFVIKFDYNGYLKFEGEYYNGEKNGKGKEYYYNHLIFEGKYINGKRNGKGKEYSEYNKRKFKGEYINGKKWNGIGYFNNFNIIYLIKNGNGYIIELDNHEKKLIFEGEYLNGERNGRGKEYYENGKLKFDGEYLNGERNEKVI